MKVRFLLDENLSPRLKAAVLRWDPTIDILRVGESDAPVLGTLDPDILRYLETTQRALVTNNRMSMPFHVADYLTIGGQHWGIFLVRTRIPLGLLAEELYTIWSASIADEWLNQLRRIPL